MRSYWFLLFPVLLVLSCSKHDLTDVSECRISKIVFPYEVFYEGSPDYYAEYFSYDKEGNISEIRYDQGGITRYTYNNNGKLMRIGTGGQDVTLVSYVSNTLYRYIHYPNDTMSQPDNIRTYLLDSLGRVSEQRSVFYFDDTDTAATHEWRSIYTWDAHNNVITARTSLIWYGKTQSSVSTTHYEYGDEENVFVNNATNWSLLADIPASAHRMTLSYTGDGATACVSAYTYYLPSSSNRYPLSIDRGTGCGNGKVSYYIYYDYD